MDYWKGEREARSFKMVRTGCGVPGGVVPGTTQLSKLMAGSRSNVDYLFHSQSIDEIKAVRQKLESDIEKKSNDLQQLVV